MWRKGGVPCCSDGFQLEESILRGVKTGGIPMGNLWWTQFSLNHEWLWNYGSRSNSHLMKLFLNEESFIPSTNWDLLPSTLEHLTTAFIYSCCVPWLPDHLTISSWFFVNSKGPTLQNAKEKKSTACRGTFQSCVLKYREKKSSTDKCRCTTRLDMICWSANCMNICWWTGWLCFRDFWNFCLWKLRGKW